MSETTNTGFAALHVPLPACQILAAAHITEPTPIQAAAIPVAMEGHDLVGIAQTGTGKTLAFALPMVARLQAGEVGLVLAPTRELAHQIARTFAKLGESCVLVVGGESMALQINRLRKNPRMIIATPGRLLDHMNQGTVRLNRVRIAVLDEADRMLDLGFSAAIKQILSAIPPGRQTLLFSATMPEEIDAIAAQYLVRPQRIEIEPAGTASALVAQELEFLPHEDKPARLRELLDAHRGSVLVFARTRHGARKLAHALKTKGHATAELHADRTLAQRREALEGFRTGGYRVLVATDIAARGIDVKGIELVVNYDLPDNPGDYIHRIGRTGRAGVAGRAITLAIPDQARDIRAIEKILGVQIQRTPQSLPICTADRHSRPVGKGQPRPDRRHTHPNGHDVAKPQARSSWEERHLSEPAPKPVHDRPHGRPSGAPKRPSSAAPSGSRPWLGPQRHRRKPAR